MARHRMLLSVDDELHGILKELSEVSGIPAATFAAQLLELSKPQLRDLVESMRLAKNSPSEAIDKLIEAINKCENEAEKWKQEAAQEKKKLE